MGDRFVVDTGNALSGKIRQYLEGFIVSEQVQIRDSTDELTQLTIQGPAAANAIQESLGINVRDMKALDVLQLGPSLMIARDRTGTSGYDIILPKDESESVWQGLLLKTGEVGAQPVGSKALEILRVEAGIPKYGVDVDENNIVLEAGYRDAINYSKGCYLGQEVVARATHIGRVNKQLAKLNIETQATIPSGTKLYSTDREAGYVTSSAYSLSRETTVGLGYVNRDYTKEGTSLQVIANGINYPVTVLSVV
jgi:folate-binding protein YgfZ